MRARGLLVVEDEAEAAVVHRDVVDRAEADSPQGVDLLEVALADVADLREDRQVGLAEVVVVEEEVLAEEEEVKRTPEQTNLCEIWALCYIMDSIYICNFVQSRITRNDDNTPRQCKIRICPTAF
jgi:predicted PilT family ATPase